MAEREIRPHDAALTDWHSWRGKSPPIDLRKVVSWAQIPDVPTQMIVLTDLIEITWMLK